MPPEQLAKADQRTHAEVLGSLDNNPVDTPEAQDLWLTDFYILSQKQVRGVPALEDPKVADYFKGLLEDEDYKAQSAGLKTRIIDRLTEDAGVIDDNVATPGNIIRYSSDLKAAQLLGIDKLDDAKDFFSLLPEVPEREAGFEMDMEGLQKVVADYAAGSRFVNPGEAGQEESLDAKYKLELGKWDEFVKKNPNWQTEIEGNPNLRDEFLIMARELGQVEFTLSPKSASERLGLVPEGMRSVLLGAVFYKIDDQALERVTKIGEGSLEGLSEVEMQVMDAAEMEKKVRAGERLDQQEVAGDDLDESGVAGEAPEPTTLPAEPELPAENYKVPMPTEQLEQLVAIATEAGFDDLAEYVHRLTAKFTSERFKFFKDDVNRRALDIAFTFRHHEDKKTALNRFKELVAQLPDPMDYKLSVERGLAEKLNPAAFEKTDLLVDDMGLTYDDKRIEFGETIYKISERLGGGDYAEVYLATSPTGEVVAIKDAKYGLRKYENNQLEEEQYYLIQLEAYQRQHNLLVDGQPLTPRFIAGGKNRGGKTALVMSRAEGKPITTLIREKDRLPQEDVITIAEQVSRVYQALHGLGKSDHDFKDSNIFWDEKSRRITIIDWNALGPGFGGSSGETILPYDPQRDLYKLNLALLRVAIGKHDQDQVLKQGPDGILASSDIDPKLKAVFSKALNVDPSQRFQTAGELRAAFAGLLPKTPVEQPSVPSPEPELPPAHKEFLKLLNRLNQQSDRPDNYFFDGFDFRYPEDRAAMVQIGALEQDEVDALVEAGIGNMDSQVAWKYSSEIRQVAEKILAQRAKEDAVLAKLPKGSDQLDAIEKLPREEFVLARAATRRRLRATFKSVYKGDVAKFMQADKSMCQSLGIPYPEITPVKREVDFASFPKGYIFGKFKDRMHRPMPISESIPTYYEDMRSKYSFGVANRKEVEDMNTIIDVMTESKLPNAVSFLAMGGNKVKMVALLEDGSVLKIAHSRRPEDAPHFGNRYFDLPILEKGSTTKDGKTVHWIRQPYVETVNKKSAEGQRIIQECLDKWLKDGYEANDLGGDQIAVDRNGNPWLIDYEAVHLAYDPKNPKRAEIAKRWEIKE